MFKLYYAAGGCSISPHIALREVGASFELHVVNLKSKKLEDGSDFLAINPKGQIPALILENGELLTEGAAIVQYIADLDPSRKLAPPAGTLERARLHEWLNFISSELHKQVSPFLRTEAPEAYKAILKERIQNRLAFVGQHLVGRSFLLGDQFSVADPYLFYILRTWQRGLSFELPSPVLVTYYQSMVQRPSVKAALLAEGLQP